MAIISSTIASVEPVVITVPVLSGKVIVLSAVGSVTVNRVSFVLPEAPSKEILFAPGPKYNVPSTLILSEDGKVCYELYEPSTFIEKWIPSPPILVNTSIIAVTAASSPIILNILKNLIKTAIKKLTKKKDEVK